MGEEEKAARIKEEIKKIKIDVESPNEPEEVATTTIKKIERKKEIRKKDQVESSSESETETETSDEDDKTEGDPGKEIPMSAEEKFEQKKKELREQREKREKRKRKIEQDASSSESEDESEPKKVKDDDDTVIAADDEDKPEVETVDQDPKPIVDIWKKRTVGEVYESALQKYWERRAARDAGS